MALRHQPMNWRDSIWVQTRSRSRRSRCVKAMQRLVPYSENKGYASNLRRFLLSERARSLFLYTSACPRSLPWRQTNFDFAKSVWANANNVLIMSPTSSKAGKHSVYLREDVFHCKLMLLNRERKIHLKINKF